MSRIFSFRAILPGICAVLTFSNGVSVHAESTAAANSDPASSGGPSDRNMEHAQDKEALAEVIVTAEKRETNLQQTPVAISVLGGASLADRKVNSVLDLIQGLSNVTVTTGTGQAQIAVRGIGFSTIQPGDESRVAYYTDGIYVSRTSAQLGSFFDVDRVEVLKGPQGTLYGRNATGGAFNVINRQPTQDTTGYVNVTGGNYNLIETDGAAGGPISDTVSVRGAFQTLTHSGYGKSTFTGGDVDGADTRSLRAILRWQPTADFNSSLEASYHYENDSDFAFHNLGPGTPGVPLVTFGSTMLTHSHDTSSYLNPVNRRQAFTAISTTNQRISEHLSAKLLLGYLQSKFYILNDGAGSTLPLQATDQMEHGDQLSAEFQLVAEYNKVHWVGGLYYFHESDFPLNHGTANLLGFGIGPNLAVQGFTLSTHLLTDAGAVFGQLTYDLTDELGITLGARYGYEAKKDRNDSFGEDLATPYPPFAGPLPPIAGFPIDQSQSYSSFTPKAGLQYKFTPQVFGYLLYSKGYKSGGFNYGNLQGPYLPEKIIDYEGGLKTTFLDRRLTANLSAFYYDYSNIQVTVSETNPPSIVVINGSSAKLYGAELETVAVPIDHLRVDAAVSWLHSAYGTFLTADPARPDAGILNLEGNHLPQSPTYTVNVGAQYSWDARLGTFTLRGEYGYAGKKYFTPFNTDETAQGAYGLGNAFVSFESTDKHWTGSVYVRNIADKFAASYGMILAPFYGGGVTGWLIPPRTVGATAGYKF